MGEVKKDFALVLDEVGMSGINLLMFKEDVPDNDAAIKDAVANKSASIVASYLLENDKIKDMIQYLKRYKRKVKLYREYLLIYKGYSMPSVLEAIISGILNTQKREFDVDYPEDKKGDSFYYTMGGDLSLFVPDCNNDYEAAQAVIKAWESEKGSLPFWDIEQQEKRDSYFITQNFQSALKFETWLFERFRIPVLVKLGLE